MTSRRSVLPAEPSRRGLARWVGVLLLAAWLPACGYSGREPFPEAYRSVAVPVFGNRSFERGVEFDLAEAITKELRRRSPYAVTRSASGDTVLEGEVVSVRRTLLDRREVGGVPQEVEVAVVIDFVWRDASTGEVILDRRGFEGVGRHVPTSPVGEPVQVAIRDAVQRLARDVVSTMRRDWGEP